MIPGRPQTKFHTQRGRDYHGLVGTLAERAIPKRPLYPTGFVRIKLELYYSLPGDAPHDLPQQPNDWNRWNIPSSDRGGQIILTALAGRLYARGEQAQPVTSSVMVMRSEQLIELFGQDCRRGAAVVRYG